MVSTVLSLERGGIEINANSVQLAGAGTEVGKICRDKQTENLSDLNIKSAIHCLE